LRQLMVGGAHPFEEIGHHPAPSPIMDRRCLAAGDNGSAWKTDKPSTVLAAGSPKNGGYLRPIPVYPWGIRSWKKHLPAASNPDGFTGGPSGGRIGPQRLIASRLCERRQDYLRSLPDDAVEKFTNRLTRREAFRNVTTLRNREKQGRHVFTKNCYPL